MNISANRLKKIIIEEYIKEELFDESQAAEDLLRKIIGDEEYNRRRALDNPDSRGGDTKPMKKSNNAAETMPIPKDDVPSDDAPESEYSGFQNDSGSELEDQLAALIQGMPPEEVSDLFQAVFSKIPGVEIGPPEEEEPDTLYSPGSSGRPQVGFKEIKNLIHKVLLERATDESYEDEIDEMSDHELMDAMETDGKEDMIVRDGEGDLVNREEVVAALKNV